MEEWERRGEKLAGMRLASHHRSFSYLARWLDQEPEVPQDSWFKRLPGMTVCGDGELVKTFLRIGQTPRGTELE